MSFSRDYAEARQKFRAATAGAAPGDHGAIEVIDGLTIDWAWCGPSGPRDHVVMFTSGVHGVEGFGGSAVQLDLIARGLEVPTLMVHVVNPWGMSNWRRVNENNVDLNRNFLPPGSSYRTDDPTYARVDALLNPTTPPGGLEWFWPELVWVVARYGYQTLKNAVVGGQGQNPKGLFFGGERLEAGPAGLLPVLDAQLGGCARVVHVDLHSALGERGGRTLLLEGQAPPEQLARARAAFGPAVKGWDASNTDAYEIRGGLLGELIRRRALLPPIAGVQPKYDGFTCEFGTLPNLPVLTRLRAENRLHHWGEPGLDHWAKAGMREAFAPLDAAWESAVLAHAPQLYAAAKAMLAS